MPASNMISPDRCVAKRTASEIAQPAAGFAACASVALLGAGTDRGCAPDNAAN